MILLPCALTHMSSIPMGGMYLYMQEHFFTLADAILYPLRVPIFTLITEVWPCANRAMVTNNSTLIIEVLLIEGFLYIK